MEENKKCKYCKSDIDKKATYCKYCRQGQGNKFIQALLLVVAIFALTWGVYVLFFQNAIDYTVEEDGMLQKDNLTLQKFNEIEYGKSYKEVVSIIGAEGTLISEVSFGSELEYETKIYQWYGKEILGANANFTFQGGKLVGKSQFGLE